VRAVTYIIMIIESRYSTHTLNHQWLSLVGPLEWLRECVVEVFINSAKGDCRLPGGRGIWHCAKALRSAILFPWVLILASKGTLSGANRFALLLIVVKAYPRTLRELLLSTSTIGVPFVDAGP